jgi:hypothetical protein
MKLTPLLIVLHIVISVKVDNIGANIYNTLTLTRSNNRTGNSWYLNVYALKPYSNDDDTEIHGLRYQSELLREQIRVNE